MKDDSLSDVNVGKPKEYEFSPNEITNIYAKEIWNEAIEAAIVVIAKGGTIVELRKLKK